MAPSFALPGILVAILLLVATALRILTASSEEERRSLFFFLGPGISLVALLLVLLYDVTVAADFAVVCLALWLSFLMRLPFESERDRR